MEKASKEIHLKNNLKKAVILMEAFGFLSVLAIGIGDYDKGSGFNPLKTYSKDTMEIQNAFSVILQWP